jgi:hypothetical protein
VLALADQLGVLDHPADRHVGGAQLRQQRQPLHVVAAVAAVAVLAAPDRVDQADALVVAQRVRAQAGALGRLRDGHLGGHGPTP